ncbi:MAG: DUF6088 family protein [bacterium]
MKSIYNQIEEEIYSNERGTIYFPDSFANIGTPEAVRLALMRLTNSSVLIRVAQGIYCYPKIDKWHNIYINPSIEDIAYALAKRDKVRIIPTGGYVLNLLGLSTQVVANAIFLTDGSGRKISIGKSKGILFKHTTEMRNFAYQSKMMQMIVFAFKEIGDNNYNDNHLVILKQHLQTVPKELYKHDIQLAPAWIKKIITKL